MKKNQIVDATPAMVDAGVTVYLERCPDSGLGDWQDRKMVMEIFAAMSAAQDKRDRE